MFSSWNWSEDHTIPVIWYNKFTAIFISVFLTTSDWEWFAIFLHTINFLKKRLISMLFIKAIICIMLHWAWCEDNYGWWIRNDWENLGIHLETMTKNYKECYKHRLKQDMFQTQWEVYLKTNEMPKKVHIIDNVQWTLHFFTPTFYITLQVENHHYNPHCTCQQLVSQSHTSQEVIKYMGFINHIKKIYNKLRNSSDNINVHDIKRHPQLNLWRNEIQMQWHPRWKSIYSQV